MALFTNKQLVQLSYCLNKMNINNIHGKNNRIRVSLFIEMADPLASRSRCLIPEEQYKISNKYMINECLIFHAKRLVPRILAPWSSATLVKLNFTNMTIYSPIKNLAISGHLVYTNGYIDQDVPLSANPAIEQMFSNPRATSGNEEHFSNYLTCVKDVYELLLVCEYFDIILSESLLKK